MHKTYQVILPSEKFLLDMIRIGENNRYCIQTSMT